MHRITPPISEDARFDHNRTLTFEIITEPLGWPLHASHGFDLSTAAHEEMIGLGFDPCLRSQQGVDVGDQLRIKLVNTDPQLGYLDFAR